MIGAAQQFNARRNTALYPASSLPNTRSTKSIEAVWFYIGF